MGAVGDYLGVPLVAVLLQAASDGIGIVLGKC